MDLQLKSKTAFISGSTQGIGFAIAHLLLAEGARVVINGRTSERTRLAVSRLQTLVPDGDVTGLAADFRIADEVNALLTRLPDIDILINNVGIFELKAFADIGDDEWERFFQINIMSGVRLSRAVLPGMLRRKWGRIVFISSESAINIPENMIHYGMTKTAMLAISRGLAKLTKNTEVTVNAILGGPTYSQGVAGAIEYLAGIQQLPVDEVKENLMITLNPTSLLQRFIEPREIANLVVYLSSPLAAATNGAAIRVDGGVLNTLF